MRFEHKVTKLTKIKASKQPGTWLQRADASFPTLFPSVQDGFARGRIIRHFGFGRPGGDRLAQVQGGNGPQKDTKETKKTGLMDPAVLSEMSVFM
jgi:hypothetical protein